MELPPIGFVPQSMDAGTAHALAASIAPMCHVSSAPPPPAAPLSGGTGSRAAPAPLRNGRLPRAVAAQVLTAYAQAAAGAHGGASGSMWGALPHLAALAEAGVPPPRGPPGARPPAHMFVRGSLHFTQRPGAHSRAVYAVSSLRNDEETLARGPNPFAAVIAPSKPPAHRAPRLAWHIPPAPPGLAAAPVPMGPPQPLSSLQRLPAAAAAFGSRQHAGAPSSEWGAGSPLAQHLRHLGLNDAFLPHRAQHARQHLQQQQLPGVPVTLPGPADAEGQAPSTFSHRAGAARQTVPKASVVLHAVLRCWCPGNAYQKC